MLFFLFSSTEIVTVLMNDGRVVVGLLKGFDQRLNIILDKCHERVFSPDAPVEIIHRGLYMIRGDNVALIGELDEDLDLELDFNNLRGEFILPIKH